MKTLVWVPACECPTCDWTTVAKDSPLYLSEDNRVQLVPIPGRLCGEFQRIENGLVQVLAPLELKHPSFVFRVTS